MSFRELRSFTEIMRTLGYPRVISMDNFRAPNFPLVADILYWLVMRYDPSAKITDDIDTESQRVAFLTAASTVMAAKARLQLKAKQLYAADGRAVKELLKIARLLLSAVRACQDALGRSEEEEGAGAGGLAFDVKPSELAATRRMASEITERGAKLHDLLVQEDEVGAVRTRALRFLDSLSTDSRGEQEALERALRGALASAQDSVAQLARRAAELDEDEQALGAKIGKKQAELDRNQKRLESLQSVRPAFMDEYEKVERELAEEHDTYVARFRNLTYLQAELEAHAQREAGKAATAARALKKLQTRLKDEETKHLRGDEEGGGGGDPTAARRPQSSGVSMSSGRASGASTATSVRAPSRGAPVSAKAPSGKPGGVGGGGLGVRVSSAARGGRAGAVAVGIMAGGAGDDDDDGSSIASDDFGGAGGDGHVTDDDF